MDRRNFLWQSGGGLGGIALAAMLADESQAGSGLAEDDLGQGASLSALHHAPKAKRVVSVCL